MSIYLSTCSGPMLVHDSLARCRDTPSQGTGTMSWGSRQARNTLAYPAMSEVNPFYNELHNSTIKEEYTNHIGS